MPNYRVCASLVVFVLLAGLMVSMQHSIPSSSASASLLQANERSTHEASANEASRQAIAARLKNVRLAFEKNQGQTDGRVKFLARGSGYTLFLTSQSAVISLRVPQSMVSATRRESPSINRDHPEQRSVFRSGSVQLDLAAANSDVAVTGEEPFASHVNYFIGNDPAKWQTNVRTYGKVRYANVYPGVDMVFHGRQSQLEYDFQIAPGADPSRIELRVRGASRVKVDSTGEAILETPLGDVALHKPTSFQGEGDSRTEVASAFELRADGSLGFRIGAYDRNRALVIDPVLTYATYLGGSLQDIIQGLAVDGDGNAYVTGITASSDFPTTPGAFQTTMPGIYTSFVTEFNPTGTGVFFSTYLGGTFEDTPWGIDLDTQGRIYIVGQAYSKDFPVTSNAFQKTSPSGGEAFLTVFFPGGAALAYSSYLGGSQLDWGNAVRVGNVSGNVFITGFTNSPDFPTTPGVLKTSLDAAVENCFVAKFNINGSGASSLLYSTYLGSSDPGDDDCRAIDRDASGNVFVTGDTSSTLFPVTAGVFQPNFGGGITDGFVVGLNKTASALLYSSYLGGTGDDTPQGIRVDARDAAYVTGYTTSSNFPHTAGVFQSKLHGASDAFVTKINPGGGSLGYSTYLGGSRGEVSSSLVLDRSGNVYVGGETCSIDFPTKNPIQSVNNGGKGHYDAFITILNSKGKALLFSTYLDGADTLACTGQGPLGYPVGVALLSGNLYVAGSTAASDFPVTSGVYQSSLAGDVDSFAVEIGGVPERK